MKQKLYDSNEDINLIISSLETNRSNLSEQEVLDKLNSEVTSISDLKPCKSNVITEDVIFEKIKESFLKEGVNNDINKTFFGCKDAKYTFMIEKTILAPNASILISSRNFEEKYLNQLESYIFTNKENIDIEKLTVLCYLFSYINKNMLPICVKSNQYKRLLPKITYTLNKFYNKNYSVIKSIYIMFNSLKDTAEESAGEK